MFKVFLLRKIIFTISYCLFSLFGEDLKSEPIYLKSIDFNRNKYKDIFMKSCDDKDFFRNLKKHNSYPRFGTVRSWKKICQKIRNENEITYKFLKENFYLKKNIGSYGILTGYYAPVIEVSEDFSDEYKYPILKYNKNLALERKKILQVYSQEDVILWTNNKVNLFFMQIQGSGVGIFEDGKRINIEYGGNNGFDYYSIGKELLKIKAIKSENMSLDAIKAWLWKNPSRIDEIFNLNERFIFFKKGSSLIQNPKGAMGTRLYEYHSIAIDTTFYPYGLVAMFSIKNFEYNNLFFFHDTGKAIKGKNRADLYFGIGKNAEDLAGDLKKKLQLILLVPYN